MHDIDRTTLEFGNETGYEAEQFEFGQNEWETGGGQLSESEEMELATELLSVTNEAELEQFLGGLLRKVASGASHLINSPTGKMLGGLLKGVAKKALPLAGGALGGVIGGPLGAKIGSGLASAAGNALGLEAEYEGEDREFEGARTFVKMAADTVNRVAQSPGGDPRQTAIQAATAAARRYAPGLLTQQQGQLQGQGGGAAQRAMRSQAGQAGMGGIAGATGGRGNHGRWVRQGRRIVIYAPDCHEPLRCLDAGAGGACVAGTAGAGAAFPADRNHGAGGRAVVGGADGHRTATGAGAARTARHGARLHGLAARRGGIACQRGRRATTLHLSAAEVQCGADAVRCLQRRGDAA